MAMRMDPQAAAQPALPDVNRGPLVFFLGFALIIINFYYTNLSNGNNPLEIIFSASGKSLTGKPLVGMYDTGLQILGLGLLVLLAQYGGEGAGSFALLFVLALWALFLVVHVGGLPSAKPAASATPGNPSGGNIQKAIE